MRAKFRIEIEYEGDVSDDPECYEGAATPEGRLAKEREYLTEGGDYLFQALSCIEHRIKVDITPHE